MSKILYFILIIHIFLYSNDDENLRNKAISEGLFSIPKDFNTIVKLLDTKENPITIKKIKLGKKLFNDKNLSLSRKISCATCHDIKNGGEDGKPTAIGHLKRENPHHLNTPTVLNSAFAYKYFWDASAPTLAQQAKGPSLASFEMASTAELIQQRVKENKEYIELFEDIFKSKEAITFDNIVKVIATYEKILLTRGDFDRYLDGDDNAISQKAKDGLNLFIKIGCKGCHNGYAIGGRMIAKFPLRHYNGLIVPKFIYDGKRSLSSIKLNLNPIYKKYPFENIGGYLGKDDISYFRVPILRNITKTAPYFHNGAVKDLDEAIFIMGRYQLGFDLTKEQIGLIKEFFKTLQGDIVDYKID
jgi:cytochrome c peroxidase